MSPETTDEHLVVYGDSDQKPYSIVRQDETAEAATDEDSAPTKTLAELEAEQEIKPRIGAVQDWLETVDNPNLEQILAGETIRPDRLQIANNMDATHSYVTAEGKPIENVPYGKAPDLTLTYPPGVEIGQRTPKKECTFVYLTEQGVRVNILVQVLEQEVSGRDSLFDADDENLELVFTQISDEDVNLLNDQNLEAVETLKRLIINELRRISKSG
jgi:hypothetical protein